MGKRIIIYCLGMLVLAFGVSLSVNSDLGVSPVNALPYVLSQIVSIDMGTCVTLVFSLYVLAQAVLLGRNFQLKSLLQVVFASLFGLFVNLTGTLLGEAVFPFGYVGRLLMLAVSMLMIAAGILLILEADIMPMPAEGLMLAICQKQKKYTFAQVKVLFDASVVVLSIVLSVTLLGGLQGVREGTVLAAVGVGKVMGYIAEPLRRVLAALSFKAGRKDGA